MFAKLIGTRTSRRTEVDRFFRPELEHLEGRLTPSGGNGHGHDGPPPGHQDNNPSPPVVSTTNHVHNNVHITATNSFNTTINNTTKITNSFNGSSFLAPPQQSSVQFLNLFSSLLAKEMGNSQLGSLLSDEIALAVDNYLLPFASSVGINTLKGDISTLQNAINANPLESTPVGQLFGTLVYDMTTAALTSAQPTV